MPRRPLPALQLARDGVLTREAVLAAGLDADGPDRLVRRGRAQRLAPSTYLVTDSPATDEQLVLAALAHAGADAVITGPLACRVLGLVDVPSSPAADVLVPAGRRRVSTPWVRVHPTTRPPRWWPHCSGARVAEPHRAVVDTCRGRTDLREIRALLLAAVASGQCCVDALRVELDTGARHGTAMFRRALGDAERGAWSAPEAEVADVVRAARLPPFLLNPTLLIAGTVVGRPDGWFLGLGLGWEVESRRHHAGGEDFDATLARHDRFAAHGLQLLHVTPRRARALGDRYAEVLRAAVNARRRAASPEPPGLVVRPYVPRSSTRPISGST